MQPAAPRCHYTRRHRGAARRARPDLLARRLASEVALSSVLEKALLLQRTLLTGKKEPNVAANQLAVEAVNHERHARSEIRNLKTELELRRELAEQLAHGHHPAPQDARAACARHLRRRPGARPPRSVAAGQPGRHAMNAAWLRPAGFQPARGKGAVLAVVIIAPRPWAPISSASTSSAALPAGERWLAASAGYFLVWRLCLYGATVHGWVWMRRRLLARMRKTRKRGDAWCAADRRRRRHRGAGSQPADAELKREPRHDAFTTDYLEYYLTLVSWIVNNGIWAVLVSSGVFALPFVAIIAAGVV